MNDTATPASPPPAGGVGLDAEWIAAHVTVDGQPAAGAEFAGFIGTGQMSRNARFRLEWPADVDGPDSVVVKVPSTDDGVRSLSFEHGVYEKECTFYDTIVPLVDICVPEPLAVVHDAAAQDFAIVLEDLDRSVQGDQFREPTTDELHLAIEQATALQAPVWNRTDDSVFDPFRSQIDEAVSRIEFLLGAFLPTVIDRLGAGLDEGIEPMLREFVANAGAWASAQASSTTFVHGDFRPDNFMFGTEASAPPLAVVDWQTVKLGLGVIDVAYLVAGALTPERRRAEEDALIDYYLAQLAQRGVDYSADECRRDYTLASLHGVVVATTATIMAEHTERGDQLFTLMLNRHGRQALDLGALDLLH